MSDNPDPDTTYPTAKVFPNAASGPNAAWTRMQERRRGSHLNTASYSVLSHTLSIEGSTH